MKLGDGIYLKVWKDLGLMTIHKGCFGVVRETFEDGSVKAYFEVAQCALSICAVLKPHEFSKKSVPVTSIHEMPNGDVKIEHEEDET